METLFGSMLDRLLMTSVQTTVLVAVAWLLCRPALRLSPATQCWLWWVVALQALLGLFVDPVNLPWLPHAPEAAATVAPSMDELLPAAGRVAMAASAGGPSPWQLVLLWSWAVGVAVMLFATLRAWRLALRLLATSMPCPDERAGHAIAIAAKACGVRVVPRLRVSSHVSSPMVVGPLRPVLLLPAAAGLGDEELGMALAHELAHLRRADLLLGLVPALARHLFFFHPLLHVAVREYGIAREAACDAAVVHAGGHSRRQYGELLLRLGTASASPGSLAAVSPTFRALSRRLVLLQDTASAPRVATVVLLLFAVAGVLPLRLVAAAGETPKPAAGAATPVQAVPSVPAAPSAPARTVPSSKAPPPGTKIAPQIAAQVAEADVVARFTFHPDPANFYPAASRAAGEEGTVRLRLCYDEAGKVVESTLAQSSSFPRLDEAALLMGRVFRFKAVVASGVPKADCRVVPVRFSGSGNAPAAPRYGGPRMSASFKDIDVATLVRIIADSSGRRIVSDPSVTSAGTITLRLNDVPWEQALDIVVETKGLEKRVTDNEIVITTK
jgi:TonB family protein